MISSGMGIRRPRGRDILSRPYADKGLNPNGWYPDAFQDSAAGYEGPTPPIPSWRRGLLPEPGRLYGAKTRASTRPESFSLCWRAGLFLHAITGFGGVGYLDGGDLRRAAGEDLLGRGNPPNRLSHHPRGVRPLCQR